MNKDIKLKKSSSGDTLYRVFIYVALITLAVTIIVPVAWVFMASVKQNSEFYGNPWTLPAGFYWQNFVDAWTKARMGEYMLNSVVVTALALGILLIVALPAAYVLSRFNFRGRGFFNTAFMGGLFLNVNYIVVPIFLMFVENAAQGVRHRLFPEQYFRAGAGICGYGAAVHHLSVVRLFCYAAQGV